MLTGDSLPVSSTKIFQIMRAEVTIWPAEKLAVILVPTGQTRAAKMAQGAQSSCVPKVMV